MEAIYFWVLVTVSAAGNSVKGGIDLDYQVFHTETGCIAVATAVKRGDDHHRNVDIYTECVRVPFKED